MLAARLIHLHFLYLSSRDFLYATVSTFIRLGNCHSPGVLSVQHPLHARACSHVQLSRLEASFASRLCSERAHQSLTFLLHLCVIHWHCMHEAIYGLRQDPHICQGNHGADVMGLATLVSRAATPVRLCTRALPATPDTSHESARKCAASPVRIQLGCSMLSGSSTVNVLLARMGHTSSGRRPKPKSE